MADTDLIKIARQLVIDCTNEITLLSGQFVHYVSEHDASLKGRIADFLDSTSAAEKRQEIMRDWQPIETAPKDGSWILVCGGRFAYGWDGASKPYAISAQWVQNEKCWQHAWYDSGFIGVYENPTHWMPLPPPPVISQS